MVEGDAAEEDEGDAEQFWPPPLSKEEEALRRRAGRLLEALRRIPEVVKDLKAWENEHEAVFALLRRGCLDGATGGMLEAPIYNNRQIEGAWLYLAEMRRRHPNRVKQIQECVRVLGASYSWSIVLRGSAKVEAALLGLPTDMRRELLEDAGAPGLFLRGGSLPGAEALLEYAASPDDDVARPAPSPAPPSGGGGAATAVAAGTSPWAGNPAWPPAAANGHAIPSGAPAAQARAQAWPPGVAGAVSAPATPTLASARAAHVAAVNPFAVLGGGRDFAAPPQRAGVPTAHVVSAPGTPSAQHLWAPATPFQHPQAAQAASPAPAAWPPSSPAVIAQRRAKSATSNFVPASNSARRLESNPFAAAGPVPGSPSPRLFAVSPASTAASSPQPRTPQQSARQSPLFQAPASPSFSRLNAAPGGAVSAASPLSWARGDWAAQGSPSGGWSRQTPVAEGFSGAAARSAAKKSGASPAASVEWAQAVPAGWPAQGDGRRHTRASP